MGGLVGLEPAEIAQALTASEMMKSAPGERALTAAKTKTALAAQPDLTFKQKMELKRTGVPKTREERNAARALTRLRDAQTRAANKGDYKTSQQYSDANAYYDDLYRKLEGEFGVWKNDMWSLDREAKATSGLFAGMTYNQAAEEIQKRIREDNRLISQGRPPNYATGRVGDVRGKGVVDRSASGLIKSLLGPR